MFCHVVSCRVSRERCCSYEQQSSEQPHDRDEIYIVASGQGTFVRGEERVAFRANDMLFVPARMRHRFEDFSADFATWVVFWGPIGGERDNPFP